jgi:hypothetical protein
MVVICSMQVRNKKFEQNIVPENLKGRDHSRDLLVDENINDNSNDNIILVIILEWILGN